MRRGLEREAHAVAGELTNGRDHVGAVGVVDGVGRAELARERQPVVVHVDRDDRVAAGSFAAIRPDSPTAPTPNTAKLSPAFGFIELNTAPAPVCTLQANAPSRSTGASLRTFTTKRSLAIAWVPNEDCWKNAL